MSIATAVAGAGSPVADLPLAEARYFAFFSYSHAEAPRAAEMQKAVEQYRWPRSKPSPLGARLPGGEPAARRLFPIFRDVDELPASSDLGAVLRQALDDSYKLVVFCSRRSARSRWVNAEVEHYLSRGRAADIILIYLDGVPKAGESGLDPEVECLPEALRREAYEPLAVDLRDLPPAGRLPHAAVLRLVAAILGCSFDNLYRRDQRRRRNRLINAAVLGVVLLAVAVAAPMALVLGQRAADSLSAADVSIARGDKDSALQALDRYWVIPAVFRTSESEAVARRMARRASFLRAQEVVQLDAFLSRAELLGPPVQYRAGWIAETFRTGWQADASYVVSFRALDGGAVSFTSPESPNLPLAVALSYGGNVALIVYSEPLRIESFDLAAGAPGPTFEAAEAERIQLLPDGRSALLSGPDGVSHVALTVGEGGPAFGEPKRIGPGAVAEAASSDGGAIALILADGTLVLVDASTVKTVPGYFAKKALTRPSITWGVSSGHLAVSADGLGYEFVDVADPRPAPGVRLTLSEPAVVAVLLDSDNLLAVPNERRELLRLSADDPAVRYQLPGGTLVHSVTSLGAPHLALLATLAGETYLVDLPHAGRPSLTYLGRAAVSLVRASADGTRVAIGFRSGRILVLGVATGAWLLDETPFAGEIGELAFEDGARAIRAYGGSGFAARYEIDPEALVSSRHLGAGLNRLPHSLSRTCGEMQLDPTNRFALVNTAEDLRIVDLDSSAATGHSIPRPMFGRRWRASFSPDGSTLALAIENEGIRFYRALNGTEVLRAPAVLAPAMFAYSACNDVAAEVPVWSSGAAMPLSAAFTQYGNRQERLVVLEVASATQYAIEPEVPAGQSLLSSRWQAEALSTDGASGFLFYTRLGAVPVIWTGEEFSAAERYVPPDGESIVAATTDGVIVKDSQGLSALELPGWRRSGDPLLTETEPHIVNVAAKTREGQLLEVLGKDLSGTSYLYVRSPGSAGGGQSSIGLLAAGAGGGTLEVPAISPRPRWLAGLDRRSLSLSVFDLADPGRPPQLYSLGGYPRRALVADSRIVAVAEGDRDLIRVIAVDPARPETAPVVDLAARLSDFGDGVRLSPDGGLLLVTSLGDGNVDASSLMEEGFASLWAGGEQDTSAWLFDLQSGERLADLAAVSVRPHLVVTALGVREGAFSANGSRLVTLSYDGTLHVWDLRASK